MLLRALAAQEARRRTIVDACKAWKSSHVAGPMYWLREHTRTENYHWQEQGLPPHAPFPYEPYPLETWQNFCTADTDGAADHIHSPESCLRYSVAKFPFEHDFGRGPACPRCVEQGFPFCVPDYMDIVIGFLLVEKYLLVPKTREMMTSWLVVGFITWYCQFFPATEWLSQSESDDKAKGLIKYANTLYTQQAEWLKTRFPLGRGDEGTLHEIAWAHGSTYKGLPSGERKLASSHPTGYFNDETAHQPAAKTTIGVALPAVKQVVCVSSVAPGWFWEETKSA